MYAKIFNNSALYQDFSYIIGDYLDSELEYKGFGGCADDLFNNEYKVAASMELMMWMRMAGKRHQQGESSPVFSLICNKYNEYIENGNLIAWGKVICRLTARLIGAGRDRERIAEAIAFLSRHPRIQTVMKKNGIVSHLKCILTDIYSSPQIKEYIGEAIRNIGGKNKNSKDAVSANSLYRNDGSDKSKPYNDQHKETSVDVPVYNVITIPNLGIARDDAIVSSAPSGHYYKGSDDRATANFYNKKPGVVDSVAAVDTPKPNKPGKTNPIAINSDNAGVRRQRAVVGSSFDEKYFDNRNSAPMRRAGVNNIQFRQKFHNKSGFLQMDKNGRPIYK
ncbi:MAG: hypothetical protein QG673_1820 [Pseudomonadota bacterium]|nr:hypothetical protein [Pseudomonadota bacterium]